MELSNLIAAISAVIAGISLILSLYAAISTYREKHIDTEIYYRWGYNPKTSSQLTFSLLITNLASRPSTITHLQLLTDRHDKFGVTSTTYNALLIENKNQKIFSDCVPLNIPPRSSKTFTVVFDDVSEYWLKQIFTRDSELLMQATINGKQQLFSHYLKNILNKENYIYSLQSSHNN